MLMGLGEVLMTSNQSAATGLLPLEKAATSEMVKPPMLPGEPISLKLFAAMNAP